MIHKKIKGMGVALITPFNEDGSVDYNALLRLVEYQIQQGTDFLYGYKLDLIRSISYRDSKASFRDSEHILSR